jgi:hypothetical protein
MAGLRDSYLSATDRLPLASDYVERIVAGG